MNWITDLFRFWFIFLLTSFSFCNAAKSENNFYKFEDQAQYELYYDYIYQLNYLEFLTADCTSNRKIGAKFYLTFSLAGEYHEIILGVDKLTDVFAGKKFLSNLWGSLVRGVKRDITMTSALDPVGYAQFKAHQLIDENKEIYEFICENHYWSEVIELKKLSEELLYDTEQRTKDSTKLRHFKSAARDELSNLEKFVSSMKPKDF